MTVMFCHAKLWMIIKHPIKLSSSCCTICICIPGNCSDYTTDLIVNDLWISSQVAQWWRAHPAKQETRVRSLGWEDSREKEKETATHSGILAWRIPWTGEPGGLQSMGLQTVGTRLHNWTTESLWIVTVSSGRVLQSRVDRRDQGRKEAESASSLWSILLGRRKKKWDGSQSET